MRLTVNGEERDLPEGTTLARLLEQLEIEGEHVAIEVNACVIRRARHAEHPLDAGDRVEIVTFVGGG